AGSRYIYEFFTSQRYDIQNDEWTNLSSPLPFQAGQAWTNGAVSESAIFVPRDGKMFRFDLADETWSELGYDIPDGNWWTTAAIFDGHGNIWYLGPDELV